MQLVENVGGTAVLGGSLASSLVGEPRSTVDVDVAVHLGQDVGDDLLDAIVAAGYYVPLVSARRALADGGSFNVLDDTAYKIDVFLLGDAPLDRGQRDRRIMVEVPIDPPVRLWVTAPEDQVLRKLDWFRQGGGVSDRQWRDVERILSLSDGLDWDYLERVAGAVGLTELLRRARADAS